MNSILQIRTKCERGGEGLRILKFWVVMIFVILLNSAKGPATVPGVAAQLSGGGLHERRRGDRPEQPTQPGTASCNSFQWDLELSTSFLLLGNYQHLKLNFNTIGPRVELTSSIPGPPV